MILTGHWSVWKKHAYSRPVLPNCCEFLISKKFGVRNTTSGEQNYDSFNILIFRKNQKPSTNSCMFLFEPDSKNSQTAPIVDMIGLTLGI